MVIDNASNLSRVRIFIFVLDPLDEPKNERTNKRMGLQIEGRQSSKALCRTIGGAGGYFIAAGHAKRSLKALKSNQSPITGQQHRDQSLAAAADTAEKCTL